MNDLQTALADVGANHSSLETVLTRLTDLQRRRSRRLAQVAAAGAGLAVAAVAGSIVVLRPAGSAPQHIPPAVVGVTTQGLNTSFDPDPSDVSTAARRAAEREAATAAARAEAARVRAAAQAAAAARAAATQEQDPREAAVLQREATARSQCQYLLTRDPTNVLHDGTVDAGAASRLGRACLGSDSASAVDVSWVVTGMDQLSEALHWGQAPVPTAVAVLQVMGADAQGFARHWFIVVLPDGAHRLIDGRMDGQPSVQQYPSMLDLPAGFDLAELGTVHRP